MRAGCFSFLGGDHQRPMSVLRPCAFLPTYLGTRWHLCTLGLLPPGTRGLSARLGGQRSLYSLRRPGLVPFGQAASTPTWHS
jgi:hypothetical protein